jgi:hypothetical protein
MNNEEIIDYFNQTYNENLSSMLLTRLMGLINSIISIMAKCHGEISVLGGKKVAMR